MKLVIHHKGNICLEQIYTYEENNNLVTFDNGCVLAFKQNIFCYGENPNGIKVAFFNYQYVESALSWLDSWSVIIPSRELELEILKKVGKYRDRLGFNLTPC